MADGITFQSATPATPPAAAVVATDDAGAAGHVQVLKLAISANGDATFIPADAANGLDVDVTRLPGTVAADLASIAAEDFATQTTLAAVLAKIIAAPATEATLASILAAVDGLEGSVDGLEGGFATLNAKDFATQTTLVAILAKIIAAPATEAKQDTLIAAVDGLEGKDYATQATLDAVLTELGQKLEAGGEVALASATLTALETITVGTALPAGANNIGDVDIASALPAGTNNIGDVDVLTLPSVSSATLSNVADSASSAQLVASNSSRKGLLIVNDSTEAVYVKYGTTASATDFTVKIAAGGYWEMPAPIYTGRLDGIWAANASGSARITEL